MPPVETTTVVVAFTESQIFAVRGSLEASIANARWSQEGYEKYAALSDVTGSEQALRHRESALKWQALAEEWEAALAAIDAVDDRADLPRRRKAGDPLPMPTAGEVEA